MCIKLKNAFIEIKNIRLDVLNTKKTFSILLVGK